MGDAGRQGLAGHGRLARHRPRHRAGAGAPRAPSSRWARATRRGSARRCARSTAAGGRRGRGGARRGRPRLGGCAPSSAILEAQGRLDHLVNNAGITRDNLLLRMKAEEWDAGAGDQPDRRLPLHAGRAAADAEAAQRPHREHHVGGGPHRQRRPGQLRRQQGGHRRLHQGGGPRGGLALHHRQRGGAGLHRDGHDRGHDRQGAGGDR